MEKKITVKEFVDGYNKLEDEEKQEYIKSHVLKNKYVNYEHKINSANRIIKSSHYITSKNSSGKDIKRLHFDTTAEYMLYSLEIVNLYTDINIDFKRSLEQFNMINGSRSLNDIINEINKTEINEFSTILEFVRNDLIKNEYEIHAYISNQINRIGELLSSILPSIIEKIDIDKVEKIVDRFIKK